nr:uncharacterized protein LOC115269116 [Aedes albopictus]
MAYAFAIIRFAMLFPLGLSMELTPEVTYQRVEQTMGFDIIRTNFRITKFNRTCAVLNGTGELLIDLDNHYTFQIIFEHSRLGNNQFNRSPIRVPEQPVCEFMKGAYREFQYMFVNTTNYPQVGPEGLCPFPAGHYWNRNLVFDDTKVPPFMSEGFWRAILLFKGPSGTGLYANSD